MPLVLSRAQALSAGRTAAEVDALVRSGRWLSLRRGVYLTRPALPDDVASRHAVLVASAVLASSVPLVASHRSAAVLHGLPLVRPHVAAPVLTRVRVPGRPSPWRSAAPLVAQVPEAHRCTVLGVPATSVGRTAIDLARTGDDVDAVLALDAALRTVSRHELEEVLSMQEGWPGSVRARRRLGLADGRAESALESLGRLRAVQQGLPTPELQVEVRGRQGFVARVDFLWRAQRTVAEADGRLKYADPQALWDEKRREDALRDLGLEVVRFTWQEALHQPELIGQRVRRAFARAEVRRAA